VLVFVLITLLGLLVFVFSLFGVIRPLQRLKVKAGQLVKGDFSAIAGPVGGIQEIEDLQTALVEMARAVQQAQSHLHGYIGAITTAQEDERTRLARDLHDDTVQTLISLNQQAQMAQRNLDRDPSAASARLTEVRQISQQAIEDIRRMIHGLHPSYLAELGLASALEMLAEQENSVVVTFQIQGDEQRLSDKIELALYRITQEALSNTRKHSQATQVTIELAFSPEGVTLTIQDNGCGFDPPELQTLPISGHYGLVGIRERTQLIEANLQINSQKGEGTRIKVQVPTSIVEQVGGEREVASL
jgi:signal transduction histidine kinase